MSNYNRTEHLKELHSKRKAMTQEKVDKAIQRFIKAQKSINFNSVASESGVTKKYSMIIRKLENVLKLLDINNHKYLHHHRLKEKWMIIIKTLLLQV